MRLISILAALLFVSAANARDLGRLNYNWSTDTVKTMNLGDCHGHVELREGLLVGFSLFVYGNDNCTNVTVNDAKVKATESWLSGERVAVVELMLADNTVNIFDVTLASNSGKTSDDLRITVDTRRNSNGGGNTGGRVDATLSSGQTANLSDCGGTVQFKVQNGQANIVFRDVVDCSNFDILSANGDSTSYANKKLGGTDRSRSGSFTLPQSVMSYGGNSVIVVVKSNSGKTEDRIRVKFSAY